MWNVGTMPNTRSPLICAIPIAMNTKNLVMNLKKNTEKRFSAYWTTNYLGGNDLGRVVRGQPCLGTTPYGLRGGNMETNQTGRKRGRPRKVGRPRKQRELKETTRPRTTELVGHGMSDCRKCNVLGRINWLLTVEMGDFDRHHHRLLVSILDRTHLVDVSR